MLVPTMERDCSCEKFTIDGESVPLICGESKYL
jgi:hypothetical protein